MREPSVHDLVEDEDGDIWEATTTGVWACLTERAWVPSWADFLSRHEPVSVYVDRAWLYGSKPDDLTGEWLVETHRDDYRFAQVSDNEDGTVELVTGPYGRGVYFDPDEATEVARALLAAAEAARDR